MLHFQQSGLIPELCHEEMYFLLCGLNKDSDLSTHPGIILGKTGKKTALDGQIFQLTGANKPQCEKSSHRVCGQQRLRSVCASAQMGTTD